jgi:hypothetical protein
MRLQYSSARGKIQIERSLAMGDKGGKKDKNKSQKQKLDKQGQETLRKKEKQSKNASIPGSGKPN